MATPAGGAKLVIAEASPYVILTPEMRQSRPSGNMSISQARSFGSGCPRRGRERRGEEISDRLTDTPPIDASNYRGRVFEWRSNAVWHHDQPPCRLHIGLRG